MNNYKNLSDSLSCAAIKRALNISYLGSVAKSAKLEKSEKNGVLTFGLYLAPWNLSGYQVCAGGKNCHDYCLNGSGQNKINTFAHGDNNNIQMSRIKKTRLFYQNRPLFMRLLVAEINKAIKRAQSLNMPFSIRLNCTSDLSPELFRDPETGKNILEMYPNIQFYDYTKVKNRVKLLGKYSNYDITFSFDGYNWNTAKQYLNNGGRVAVVFESEKLPKYFDGYKVINGNTYDFRYLDDTGVIVGLSYHKTAHDYKTINGKRVFIAPKTPFIIKNSDPRNVF